MTLCTLSVLLLASPFARELFDLTVCLAPLIVEAGKLIQRFRNAEPTPQKAQEFEQQLGELARRTCREIVAWVYNHVEPDQLELMPSQLCFEGEHYRRRPKSPNRKLATLFGTIVLWRFRYEPLEAGLRSIFPLEIQLGIEAARATPALAERVGQWSATSTQKMVLEILRRDHNVSWAVKTLRKVTASLSAGMAEHRQAAQVAQVLGWLKEAFASAGPHRPLLCAGRDGVFVPLRDDTEYREGATGTLSVYDRRGQRLGTVYLGRMPEKDQVTLSSQMTALIESVLEQWLVAEGGELPRLEYCTDGGHHPTVYYVEVLTKLEDPRHPGKRLVWEWVTDFYHACSYIGKLAEALFGGATQESHAWSAKMRKLLRDKRNGIYRVLHSAAGLRAFWELTPEEETAFDKAYAYLRKRMPFMNYSRYRAKGMAIGSGVTEAACKTVFTQRLKQSGMKWAVDGGQVILDLRVIWLSGVWQAVHRSYLASKPQPDMGRGGAKCGPGLKFAA